MDKVLKKFKKTQIFYKSVKFLHFFGGFNQVHVLIWANTPDLTEKSKAKWG